MDSRFVIELLDGRYLKLADGWFLSSVRTKQQASQFSRFHDAAVVASKYVPSDNWKVVPVEPEVKSLLDVLSEYFQSHESLRATMIPSLREIMRSFTVSVPLSEQQRYPRRTDWPLCFDRDQIRRAVLCATSRRIGIRVPVVARPGVLAFEPPLSFWVQLDSGGADACARVQIVCGYFPAGFPPREWHVEYSLEFSGVPRELIPVEFAGVESECGE